MADHRHKRDTNARPLPKAHLLAGPIAVVATASTVGFGLVATDPEARDLVVASSGNDLSGATQERQDVVSRGSSRDEMVNLQRLYDVTLTKVATMRAVRNADTKRWTTADLNLWDGPGKQAKKLGLLQADKKVLITGRQAAGRDEIVWNGKARWVTSGYLAAEKEKEETSSSTGGNGGAETAPSLGAACTNGSSVDGQPNVIAVHAAVCGAFPELTSYGTYRSDGEHAQGLAIDIMVSGSRGWEVAEFVRANYSELGVSYIMYAQRIWSVDRSSGGWRYVEDRGSATANHYDHVHVTTY